MNPGGEARGGPVTARRDRPELPGLREETVHHVPPPVHLPVTRPRCRPVPFRRDHRLRAAPVQVVQQPVGAGRPVADEGPELQPARKPRHPLKVVRPGGQYREPHGISQGVHDGDGPGRQATPGTSGSLILAPPPFLAPAAFRGAWTTVPSTDTRSGPESPDRALGTRPETPESTRRRNRLDTPRHLADRSGRSRHADPVRNRTGTASGKGRLSAAVPPGIELPARQHVPGPRPHGVRQYRPVSIHGVTCMLSCRAAVPAVAGAGNGTEPGDPQPECQQALNHRVKLILASFLSGQCDSK